MKVQFPCIALPIGRAIFLLEIQQFDIENQDGIRWDFSPRTAFAITHSRRQDKGRFHSFLHYRHTFVPALNYLAFAQRELERFYVVESGVYIGIKLLAM